MAENPSINEKKGKRIPEEQRKEIAFDYSQTESYNKTAKKYGTSANTVKAIVKSFQKFVDDAKAKKRKTVDNFIKAMQDDATKAYDISNLYLNSLAKKTKIDDASAKDSATVYGILVDKQIRLEEIRLKRLELEIKKKEVSAMEKGVTINVNPQLVDFSTSTGDMNVKD